jgi:metal-responsive CopG/Arc/MetJ family transcriptional regulator
MKTAVSIPDPLFEQAEELAERLQVSRSELYATALRVLVAEHDEEAKKRALDEVYATEASELPKGARRAQARILSEWSK